MRKIVLIAALLALAGCDSRLENLENADLKCWRLTDGWGVTGVWTCDKKVKP